MRKREEARDCGTGRGWDEMSRLAMFWVGFIAWQVDVHAITWKQAITDSKLKH